MGKADEGNREDFTSPSQILTWDQTYMGLGQCHLLWTFLCPNSTWMLEWQWGPDAPGHSRGEEFYYIWEWSQRHLEGSALNMTSRVDLAMRGWGWGERERRAREGTRNQEDKEHQGSAWPKWLRLCTKEKLEEEKWCAGAGARGEECRGEQDSGAGTCDTETAWPPVASIRFDTFTDTSAMSRVPLGPDGGDRRE